jgi:hypothetical protein
MECKNCELPLRTDYSFCSNCGAKIIRNRLNFKNLWYDVTVRYFNVDNTFLKTFWHLFVKPERVIHGYIDGIRKKYLNPIAYLGIALTFSGAFLFLMRRYFLDKMEFNTFGKGLDPEVGKKLMTTSLDFSSFIFLLYIPLIAIVGWLIYNRKAHNLSEYSVTAIYSLAHYSIFTFPISIAMCIISPENYMSYSMLFILIMALYVTYVVNRIHGKNIGKSIIFVLIFAVGFMAMSLALNIIFVLSGVIDLQDFIPKK